MAHKCFRFFKEMDAALKDHHQFGNDMDLVTSWRLLVRRRNVILRFAAIATMLAVALAFLMPPVYRAEVLLLPASQERGMIASLMGQFGDLASVAGINVGATEIDSTAQAVATLKSRTFTDAFIRDEGLMPFLFPDEWDDQTKTWRSKDQIPSAWVAYELFDRVRSVQENKKNGLVTVAVEWEDPVQAANWANKLVKRLNKQLQHQAITESQKAVSYLQAELARTNATEVQQAIFRVIESQEKNRALASVRDEYAFKIIDPAVVPEKRVRPRRGLIVVIGMLFGLMLGVAFALVASEKKGIGETNP